MKNVIGVLATVLLLSSVSFATDVDIKGYAYHIDYNSPYPPNPASWQALPVTNAEVTLYKRDDASISGWVVFCTSVSTNLDGYYVFENIDVGDDIGDLCTNSNWFRVEVDANEYFHHIPTGWPHFDILDRFSHNEPRPDQIPDAEDIRVDFVFDCSDYSVYSGRPIKLAKIVGHFVTEDVNGIFYTPFHHRYKASCPIGINEFERGGCLHGHWTNITGFTAWINLDAYSRYIFTFDNTGIEIARCYTYWTWTLPWPSWAAHVSSSQGIIICRDFVYLQPNDSSQSPTHPFSTVNSGVDQFGTVHSWPNPSAQRTELHYSLSEACDVELSLFDLSGRLVSVLVEGLHEAGEYTVLSGDLRSGIYLCRLEAGSAISTTRLLIE